MRLLDRRAQAACRLAMRRNIFLLAPPPSLVLFACAEFEVVVALDGLRGAHPAALRARRSKCVVDAAVLGCELLAMEALAGRLQPRLDALIVLAVAVLLRQLLLLLALQVRIQRGVRTFGGQAVGRAEAARLRAVVSEGRLVAPRGPLRALEALASRPLPFLDALLVLAARSVVLDGLGQLSGWACLARLLAILGRLAATVLASELSGQLAALDVLGVGLATVAVLVAPLGAILALDCSAVRGVLGRARAARLPALVRRRAVAILASLLLRELALRDVLAVCLATVAILILPGLVILALLLLLVVACVGVRSDARRRRGLRLLRGDGRGRLADEAVRAHGRGVFEGARGAGALELGLRGAVAAARRAEGLTDRADVRVRVAVAFRRDDGARHAVDHHVLVGAAARVAVGLADDRRARQGRRAGLAGLGTEVRADAVLLSAQGDRGGSAPVVVGERGAAVVA
mmetsp:Transcript_53803/g.155296  ORF Transcript_53803/g.155296 Transcript_53803/m.155296 type:complete len:461 (-) Transcript_53803:2240-3622(-)